MTPTVVETIEHLIHKTAPPYDAGRKRPHALALAVYDPAVAAQHANRSTEFNISANAGALVPFVAPLRVIDAVSLAAVAPSRPEPSWMRTRLFELGFRIDMDVHFIAEKAVTATDLDAQQTRFRLPNDGVQRHLRGLLSDDELQAADLLHEKAPRPRAPKQPPINREQGGSRTKKKGKNHVGLPVFLLDASGRKKELKLTRWESSGSTVIHGDGYLDFIRQCGFKQGEVVEIRAFREKLLHLMGVDWCVPSPLYFLIAKKEQQLVA